MLASPSQGCAVSLLVISSPSPSRVRGVTQSLRVPANNRAGFSAQEVFDAHGDAGLVHLWLLPPPSCCPARESSASRDRAERTAPAFAFCGKKILNPHPCGVFRENQHFWPLTELEPGGIFSFGKHWQSRKVGMGPLTPPRSGRVSSGAVV